LTADFPSRLTDDCMEASRKELADASADQLLVIA